MTATWWWTFMGHGASPNDFYNFTSGPIVVLSIFTFAWSAYKARQCHSKRCWRWGHYRTADGLYRLCHYCHPDVPHGGPTREQARAHHLHARNAKSQPANKEKSP